MTTETRQNIITELTLYLNRPPTEKEIMNAQADINIMGKVKDKQEVELKKRILSLETKLK